MSNYATVQSALLTVIRLLTSTWTSANSKEYDYRIMDAGVDRFLVLDVGESPTIQSGAGFVMREWEVIIDLGYRVSGNEVDAKTSFITDRDALIAHLEKYPTLNGTANVQEVRINVIGDVIPVPVDLENNRETVAYFWQELRVSVVVNYAITGGEY